MQKLNLGDDYNDQTAPTDTSATPMPAAAPVAATSSMNTQSNVNQKGSSMARPNSTMAIVILVVALAAGAFTGFGAYKLQAKTGVGLAGGTSAPISQVAGSDIKAGDVFGVQDEKTFKDSADGYLEIGGANGEGSHHLLRAGGDSQTVYLTSSVTDLDKFDGMQVKVWGETFKGQKVGWLMDVGRVQVVDPNGQKPTE